MSTQQDEVGNAPYSSIWRHMYLKTAFYLLLVALIFLNKTDGLFLLFRFVSTIRGRIDGYL